MNVNNPSKTFMFLFMLSIFLTSCSTSKSATSTFVNVPYTTIDTYNGGNLRKVVYRNTAMIRAVMYEKGVITFKVCVNELGKTISVDVVKDQTTISSIRVLKKAHNIMFDYRFAANPAKNMECGKFIVNVEGISTFSSF